MTAAGREGLSEAALAMTQPIIDALIKDISRRIKDAGGITDTAEYQIYRAQALGASKREIEKRVAEQLEIQQPIIDSLFEYVVDQSASGAVDGSMRQVAAAYAELAKRRTAEQLNSLWADTADGQTLPLQEAYAHNMDFAFRKVITGAEDLETALRRATDPLAKRGLRTIEQKSGRSVGIEYAVRRYLMDQLGQLDDVVQQSNHDALGCDGWEISAHAACAPDHEPIQGRQFSDAEFEALNNSLQRRIGHLNCGHTASPIILGVNEPQYTEAELQRFKEDNARGLVYNGHQYTLYEAGQKQSSIENGIRMIKRQCLVDEETGNDAALQKHQIKLRVWQAEYKRFCKAAKLPTRTERLRTAGFGRVQAGKAWGYQSQKGVPVQKVNFAKDTPGEEQVSILKELLRVPEAQRSLAENQISAVRVVKDGTDSSYNPKSKVITLSTSREFGDVIHEFGHALERELDLAHNPEYKKIRIKGLDVANLDKVVYDRSTFAKPIYYIEAEKLISVYQGRIYDHPDTGIMKATKNEINENLLLEYFSEGYREYYVNPDNLKRHDPDLYEFIRGLPK